jgi:transcriptional regulator with XRE-family HTH domain
MSVELRIKEIIKEKKMHQKDLAQQIGVSKVTVSYWCNNQTLPSIETLGSIDKVLKVRIADLIVEN